MSESCDVERDDIPPAEPPAKPPVPITEAAPLGALAPRSVDSRPIHPRLLRRAARLRRELSGDGRDLRCAAQHALVDVRRSIVVLIALAAAPARLGRYYGLAGMRRGVVVGIALDMLALGPCAGCDFLILVEQT
ncbi:MAG TPA: hypothetical protein VGR35_10055 [Tepidisphaeraceae bacterium]|nr:hypothetical protein [Tepidisphaeraceae bacterium]